MAWKINPRETTGHAAVFVDDVTGTEAHVKWDGCVNLWPSDTPDASEEERCYHHICDLDEVIAALVALKERALSYYNETTFGIGGWPTEESKRDAIEYVQMLEAVDAAEASERKS